MILIKVEYLVKKPRGHSTTTWTNLAQLWPPTHSSGQSRTSNMIHTYPLFTSWTSVDFLLPNYSCPRCYWMSTGSWTWTSKCSKVTTYFENQSLDPIKEKKKERNVFIINKPILTYEAKPRVIRFDGSTFVTILLFFELKLNWNEAESELKWSWNWTEMKLKLSWNEAEIELK